ncbi:TIGR03618 family F420-dependent PPOX class oxidoreductase [Streptomyces pinistramenti]|uniref:TIGR03618 family F420-dependent PPOX class oxidoreductase n=1 Tax=Streptomyces pinistramenti TaxID=2884812 RepID=UPI001D07E268|nr:TIGR03618 family F420-dependent PPOX class oxidoreductase [Streptomyces pinistramenti]MCB5908593.1 TIGR03618 family F420-dependent PPOX class oxidoreductase [Streptomyces pinistramenti]
MAHDLAALSPEYLAFWGEYFMPTLTTLRPDGTPHVVPVGVTYDAGERIARIITRKDSTKVKNVRAAGTDGASVAVCQVDRGRWATLEGIARVRTDADAVADAVHRYAERYGRTPGPNPDRVMIEIAVTKALGRA